ncbi:MAG: 30S ribosomal protein S24e [Candidatus Methanomethylicia archaeon]|nr:30S ribosomal protein S24e [Candidatus Methanomethylicia archaeon]MCX8169058.1 30S ribosomal protein S24e [Candidatus Methanomethylicia archaeon]MDW7988790.1 30S ribosomal protein S24e [Nitrososphaerota archaeon]
MDLEIVSKRENKMLSRLELDIVIKHVHSGTPNILSVRETVASLLKIDVDRIYVVRIVSEYGVPLSKAHVHIYDSKEKALEIEPEHIINKNIAKS